MSLKSRIEKLEKLLDVGQPSPVEMERCGIKPDMGLLLRALLDVCELLQLSSHHRGRIRALFSRTFLGLTPELLDFIVGYVVELLSLSPEDRRQFLDSHYPSSADRQAESPSLAFPEDHYRNEAPDAWGDLPNPSNFGEPCYDELD
jgi:hypothetical protein